MDYDSYRNQFYTSPAPQPRFEFTGLLGVTLFFSDFDAVVEYYGEVLGPPAYVEGDGTRGWPIGRTWLTLLKGKAGIPQNVEFNIVMQTPQAADRLQAAFIEAGGTGDPPSDELMYELIRFCPVQDPFGTNILIISPLR